jgi:Ala-tRNA(Pro) deacylase
MTGQRAAGKPHGIDVVTELLARSGVPYEIVEHEATYSARAEAHAAASEPGATAKTVALHDRDGYRLAVVPASERLDVRRAREVLGASHHLRLATEEEMREEFPTFDVGAIPPFAPGRLPEVVDIALLHHQRIVCAGGEHERSVRIAPLDLLRLAEPRVADICEHPEDREQLVNPPSF